MLYRLRVHCELISGTKRTLSMYLCWDQLIHMSREYSVLFYSYVRLYSLCSGYDHKSIDLTDHFLSSIFRLTKKGDIHYEALLGNLKPHMAYMIRIAAVNQIDKSTFTEPVVVKTQEEGKETNSHIRNYMIILESHVISDQYT